MIRLLLLFTLSLQIIYNVNACSCVYFPIQQVFCGSDFVIKLKVEDISNLGSMVGYEYKIDVLETYKATEKAKTALTLKKLTTFPFEGMCGLQLQQNQIAVVGGRISNGKPYVNVCDLNLIDPQIIEAEETNLRDNFPKNCV